MLCEDFGEVEAGVFSGASEVLYKRWWRVSSTEECKVARAILCDWLCRGSLDKFGVSSVCQGVIG
jgi:hypothetical protein